MAQLWEGSRGLMRAKLVPGSRWEQRGRLGSWLLSRSMHFKADWIVWGTSPCCQQKPQQRLQKHKRSFGSWHHKQHNKYWFSPNLHLPPVYIWCILLHFIPSMYILYYNSFQFISNVYYWECFKVCINSTLFCMVLFVHFPFLFLVVQYVLIIFLILH